MCHALYNALAFGICQLPSSTRTLGSSSLQCSGPQIATFAAFCAFIPQLQVHCIVAEHDTALQTGACSKYVKLTPFTEPVDADQGRKGGG